MSTPNWLQAHPYIASPLSFFVGLLSVRFLGRICSRMSQSNMYALCHYYVFIFLLSSFIIYIGVQYGYIQANNNGKYEGFLGYLINKALDFMTDTEIPLDIFYFDMGFTIVAAILIFFLAGLTSSLPRCERMYEPFGKVFLKNGKADSEHNIEVSVSKLGKKAFWFSALLLVKSTTSFSSFILSAGFFCVYYKWTMYGKLEYLPWFIGLSMALFATAILVLCFVMHTLLVISGEGIFLNHDLWEAASSRRWLPRGFRRWVRLSAAFSTLLPGKFKIMRARARARIATNHPSL